MRKFITGLLLLAGLAAASASHAAVISGQIRTIDGDLDGAIDDLKISRVTFSVTAGTTVFFDSLVRESTGVDLNGDGRITGFDNYMGLFSGNTSLIWNDDSGATFADGSVHTYDSAFSYTFSTAGDYMVTLGQLSYSDLDALRGFRQDRTYAAYDGNENWGAWRLTMTATGGDLSNLAEVGVTPANVPEPASLALLGAGLFGVAAARRKAARKG